MNEVGIQQEWCIVSTHTDTQIHIHTSMHIFVQKYKHEPTHSAI